MLWRIILPVIPGRSVSEGEGNPQKNLNILAQGLNEMEEKLSYVYIMASGNNGTLYIGVTSDLINRVNQHKEGIIDGFTKKYNVKDLVYFETFGDIRDAIFREKQLKKWNREWKKRLIEKDNLNWKDLSQELF